MQTQQTAIQIAVIGTVGLLVLVRTFLSWSLEVEIEGQWPWERARSRQGGDEP